MSAIEGIYNFRRLDDRITTSGQPDEDQLGALAAEGVTTVVNLGLQGHDKALPDEAASVAALGMAYVHIPVPFDAPDDNHYAAFVAALEAASGDRVHVHCIANMRVTAFTYRWLRTRLGQPETKARALMDSVWQPGGAWARFVGDPTRIDREHDGPLHAPPDN